MSLRILKLGWEFPPHNYGGLGVACEGLVRGLTKNGAEIVLILPRNPLIALDNVTIFATDDGKPLKIHKIDSLLRPYLTSELYDNVYQKNARSGVNSLYGNTIFAEVERYAQVARKVAKRHDFDLIHAHDWMSFKAGVFAKKVSGKPLIVHVHATEFDRTGNNGVHQFVYDIERWGMQEADKVIAVSNFTKNKIIAHYGIKPEKIEVVHNAIWPSLELDHHKHVLPKQGPIVLFLGRLTLQKGPDYFISAAHAVLHHRPETMFVVAGSGDMEHRLIEWVASTGMGDKILFAGQLSGHDVDRAYRMADVFVMPSVSEPFGLTALEAIRQGTPVIISKQSGVSEVIGHVLRVDFWDSNDLVNKIIAMIDHHELKNEIVTNAYKELKKFSWYIVAQKCINLYRQCLGYI